MINILDCTLRDGGLGLEDLNKNNLSDIAFSEEQVNSAIDHLNSTGLDIVELGSIEITKDNRKRFCIYQNIEEISKKIPSNPNISTLYVGLFRGPDTPMEDIPEWRPGLIEGLRVILRYSELQKSLDFCAGLAEKGYKVFVQPMLTMRYTDDELNFIISRANAMCAYACYFVDSYGYMEPEDIQRLFTYYNNGLNHDIWIGFHAHNNMNLAYSNAIEFIRVSRERKIILDSCAAGMGQGAGNLQTELITNYANSKLDKHYDYNEILNLCEIVDSLNVKSLWGYSVIRMLPAIHKAAYKFSVYYREICGLSYADINHIFMNMPGDIKHRYTEQVAKELLTHMNHKKLAESS